MRNHMRSAALLQFVFLLGAIASARAQEQDSATAVFEKHGMLGTWASDCSKRASTSNYYIAYRALDERRIQRDAMMGPAQRSEVAVIESATEAGPHDVTYIMMSKTTKNEYRDVVTERIEGNRRMVMELVTNGEQQIVKGVHLKTKLMGSSGGKRGEWFYRCD